MAHDPLTALEQQSIHVIREAYARLKPLGMLWSLGKDSNTMLWLVRKAFVGRVPFPVVLLDTGNEFDEVYAFRDRYVKEWGLDYINAVCPGVEETDATLPPASRAAARKTLGLKRLIAERGFAGMLLGIRRDEQAIRGKERYMSPRDADGRWHVRAQPTELWGHYQASPPSGGHVRVHPLLAWTELDVWRYVAAEDLEVPSIYFAHRRPVVERTGMLWAVGPWTPAGPDEQVVDRVVRYRTVGDMTCTGAVASEAATLEAIIAEVAASRITERGATRADDRFSEAAMEDRKREGYF